MNDNRKLWTAWLDSVFVFGLHCSGSPSCCQRHTPYGTTSWHWRFWDQILKLLHYVACPQTPDHWQVRNEHASIICTASKWLNRQDTAPSRGEPWFGEKNGVGDRRAFTHAWTCPDLAYCFDITFEMCRCCWCLIVNISLVCSEGR